MDRLLWLGSSESFSTPAACFYCGVAWWVVNRAEASKSFHCNGLSVATYRQNMPRMSYPLINPRKKLQFRVHRGILQPVSGGIRRNANGRRKTCCKLKEPLTLCVLAAQGDSGFFCWQCVTAKHVKLQINDSFSQKWQWDLDAICIA